jgi:Luciferase-like monooxygenase
VQQCKTVAVYSGHLVDSLLVRQHGKSGPKPSFDDSGGRMEIGVYSFGDVQRDRRTGERGSTADATRNLLEAIKLADEVGLDYFGIGEHHTYDAPASAAAVILGAAASLSSDIKLGSAVTVLSTEDPVRVFQQFATVDARCRTDARKSQRDAALRPNRSRSSDTISPITTPSTPRSSICC